VRPGQHQRVFGCGVFTGGEAAENFLGARAVVIEQRDQAEAVPGANLDPDISPGHF